MNAKDRKRLASIKKTLEEISDDLAARVGHISHELRSMSDNEIGEFSDLSDNAQRGERGQRINKCADILLDVTYSLDKGDLSEAIDILLEVEELYA